MVHRHILHGVFPDGPGLQRLFHRLFDHLHLTSGLWDVVNDTRIPADLRAALYDPLLGKPALRRQAP